MAPFPIAHLTSVHPRNDIRIFHKQCRSLANAGYQVTLVVADGKGTEVVNGVSVHDVGKPSSRLHRMVYSTRRVYQAARQLNAKIYHLHDPELLPFGPVLKKLGRTVIFDAHEDVAKQIISKPYIPQYVRTPTSVLYGTFEARAIRYMDAIICATPSIAETFAKYGAETTIVANYPIVGELVRVKNGGDSCSHSVCYIGGLSDVRGLREIVKAAALSRAGVQLKYAGRFESSSFKEEIIALPEARKAIFLGWLDRGQIAQLVNESMAGLVTLHETPNHRESLPIKMFEYMSGGLPVIASNFPLWQKILTEANCGICVDPTDVQAIADAMDELANNRERAAEMGRNGQVAVSRKYNWATQEDNLLALYEKLVESGARGPLDRKGTSFLN
jgi:glycosyltransferase involved in cell wall biosynthesis